jgi:hypothetical protein
VSKKAKPRGRVIASGVVPKNARREGELLFVDRDGNVRAVKAKVGGTKGARRCKGAS